MAELKSMQGVSNPTAGAVLKRFSEMVGDDFIITAKVCDRPGELQHSMIPTSCKLQLTHRLPNQRQAWLIETAVFAYFCRPHVCIGDEGRVTEPQPLALPRPLDPLADGGRWFA